MAEPINPLYLKILDACRAQAPEPLYPKPFAIAENLDRRELDEALDHLRVHGLVRFTDWVQGMGQGYALTDEGAEILKNPLLLNRPRPAPTNPRDTGPEHEDSVWERGEAIRNCLLYPIHPTASRVILIANLIVFAIGWWLASQRNIGSDYLTGNRGSPAFNLLLVEMGSCRKDMVDSGEWWRLLTYAFLHIGVLHLALNMYFLYNIGTLVESLFGSWRYAVLYIFGAITGGVGAYFARQGGAAGASGALSGVLLSMGVWLYMSRRHLPSELVSRWQSNILTNVLMLVVISLIPGVSWEGHLGGAVGGAVMAVFLHWNRFAVGALRWFGAGAMVLVPTVLLAYFTILPNPAREVAGYQVRLQDERTTLDDQLIDAFNKIALPMLKNNGPPKDASDVEAQLRRADATLEALTKTRAEFERFESSSNESIQASVQDNLKNIDAWLALVQFCQTTLREPADWNNPKWFQLDRLWREVARTQLPLSEPSALIATRIDMRGKKSRP